MDFFKKAQGMVGGSGSNKQAGQHQGQPAGQKEDYGDKAISGLMNRAGQGKNKDRDEKIGDGLRGLYEKATGKKVNPKLSN